MDFITVEDSAILKGMAELENSQKYDSLYDAALCRAKSDWLIGINASRLFSCLYHKTLNVGRVMTPTLAFLTEREKEINNFQKQKTEKPPKLYDLTTLQREANKIYGYTAQQTLEYLQSLYEKK